MGRAGILIVPVPSNFIQDYSFMYGKQLLKQQGIYGS